MIEIRTCICGCARIFECKKTSIRKYFLRSCLPYTIWNKNLTKENSDSMKKISLKATGRKLSDNHCKNISNSLLNRTLSEEYTDGQKQLMEVKPKFKLGDAQVHSKLEAGKRFAEQTGMKFDIWTEELLFKK